MPHPFLIFSQSDYLIWVFDRNSHIQWQTVQIQISWLLQKPTDLNLHCLLGQGMSCSAREGLKTCYRNLLEAPQIEIRKKYIWMFLGWQRTLHEAVILNLHEAVIQNLHEAVIHNFLQAWVIYWLRLVGLSWNIRVMTLTTHQPHIQRTVTSLSIKVSI